jgi:ubiquinone/menaquinone biosynthesis C-methylase UbiE
MLERVPETEVMDVWEDAVEYDSMDFTGVNGAFAQRSLELGPPSGLMLDCGTATARIPILILQQNINFQITGIDLSGNMLKIGEANIVDADLRGAISLHCIDAKELPFPNNHFDMVISNSLLHHLSIPISFLKEANRVIKPNGGILIRDLIRPKDRKGVDLLVDRHTGDSSDRQRKLFQESLLSSFTLKEVEELLTLSGIHGARVVQSSDRHWSIERKWYKEMKKDFSLSL